MEFENLVQSHIGDPGIAVTINGHAVRHVKQNGTPRIQRFTRIGVQFDNSVGRNGTQMRELIVVGLIEGSAERVIDQY